MVQPVPSVSDASSSRGEDAVLIIAEAGVNHNGDPALAHALVDAAADAGADAVKFQTFKAEQLVVPGAPKAEYQKRATDSGESQFEMLRRLELDWPSHHALKTHAERRGLRFLSTAFDHPSLAFLVRELGLKTLKIPSGELTNGPFLLAHARSGCARVIMSTGMANLAEVEEALGVLAYGFIESVESRPEPSSFPAAYASPEGRRALRERVILLHCTSEYPAAPEQVNLRAMDTLAAAFGLPVGYSDHTVGAAVAIAAVARGARVIEKHFTLDRNLAGPDHGSSLEPAELARMIADIRRVEACLGDGIKRPQAVELETARVVRKSLVASRPIAIGERFSDDNLAVRRPGGGLSPMAYWSLLGSAAAREYAAGDPILG
jgi:N-acetylneuraminate synthase